MERGDEAMLKYANIIDECNPSQCHSELDELLTLVEPIKPKNILENVPSNLSVVELKV